MTTSSPSVAQRLQSEIVEPLKQRFVGRDEVVHLIALASVAREHLFLFGPPGTAKSALIRHFGQALHGRYFEYMLTRFSEPNEIFGPVDIAQLREGRVVTVTSGMLPEAEFVFLDELFNANSAILNNLLTVLNERVYRRGLETHRLPLISLFSASNHLPEDDALRALFDRFLLRCQVKNLPRDSMPGLLRAGWALETAQQVPTTLTADDLNELAKQIYAIDLGPILERYIELSSKVRDLGVAFSDRRAVKVLKLAAASALLCGRTVPAASDLWPMRYVWDSEEQIEPLAALVNGYLEEHAADPGRHPLATMPQMPTGDDLARQLETLEQQMQEKHLSLTALGRLRERLGELADQAAWLSDARSRQFLLDKTRQCLERIGK